MKKLLYTALMIFVACFYVEAQNIIVPEGYEMVDSLVYRPADTVDSSLVGKSVFEYSGADIRQDQSIETAMESHLRTNEEKTMTGYRVRIFFDNKQNARTESEETLKRFNAAYPGIPSYRSYVYPFFKVTIGDFRTKSEAMRMMQMLVREYPAAFVVKEAINHPVVDDHYSYVVDTLHILRKIPND